MEQLGMTFIEIFTTVVPYGDKFLHLLIGNMVYNFQFILGLTRKTRFVSIFSLALAKETYDAITQGKISEENLLDLIATMVII